MNQIIPQTDDQKMKMYMKLSKKELASMLIQANKENGQRGPVIIYPDNFTDQKQTYFDICPCNPKNGGSGICGCTLGNPVTFTSIK